MGKIGKILVIVIKQTNKNLKQLNFTELKQKFSKLPNIFNAQWNKMTKKTSKNELRTKV